MPEYLIIETTGGGNLETGSRRLVTANTPQDAVAQAVGDAYAYEQIFSLFDVSGAILVKTEQERIIRALDASDETGTTVLEEYTEADIVILQEDITEDKANL